MANNESQLPEWLQETSLTIRLQNVLKRAFQEDEWPDGDMSIEAVSLRGRGYWLRRPNSGPKTVKELEEVVGRPLAKSAPLMSAEKLLEEIRRLRERLTILEFRCTRLREAQAKRLKSSRKEPQ